MRLVARVPNINCRRWAARFWDLAAYVAQIGGQETTAPTNSSPSTGAGLLGQYFNNTSLTGTPVLQRTEAVNFGWRTNSPGPGVNSDKFSVRWSGKVKASSTGNFQFQTASNDGVRVWINGVLVINNWTNHATTTNNSASISLVNGTRYAVTMEFYDGTGAAVARLRWKRPGQTSYVAIPASFLYAN